MNHILNHPVQAEKERRQKEVDTLTRLLCSTLSIIDKHNQQNLVNQPLPAEFAAVEGLTEWWTAHKRWDELRKIREENEKREHAKKKLVATALNKLTLEEKTALGL